MPTPPVCLQCDNYVCICTSASTHYVFVSFVPTPLQNFSIMIICHLAYLSCLVLLKLYSAVNPSSSSYFPPCWFSCVPVFSLLTKPQRTRHCYLSNYGCCNESLICYISLSIDFGCKRDAFKMYSLPIPCSSCCSPGCTMKARMWLSWASLWSQTRIRYAYCRVMQMMGSRDYKFFWACYLFIFFQLKMYKR